MKKLILTLALVCTSALAKAQAKSHIDDSASTLPDLLKLYQEVSLPLPPKDTKLVRFAAKAMHDNLGFLIDPKPRQKVPVLLVGTYMFADDWPRPTQWQIVAPTAVAAKDMRALDLSVALAVQCQYMGWHELAAEILQKIVTPDSEAPKEQIIHEAWRYWRWEAMNPGVDRRHIAARLKHILALYPNLAGGSDKGFLQALELALAPSKAKPRSVDAMIDAAADHSPLGPTLPNDPIRSLKNLGFDAVPSLIEHLEDARLTRTFSLPFNNSPYRELLVQDLVSEILMDLAGRNVASGWKFHVFPDLESSMPFVKADVLDWWEVTRKIGEEPYLLKRALSDGLWPNVTYLDIIGQKYPKNLEQIYRTTLEEHTSIKSEAVLETIQHSTLSAAEKIRLLRIGAAHQDAGHRERAKRVLIATFVSYVPLF